MSARPRIGVVGVGSMGSQAAWRLAERGADVIGFERFSPGHDQSAAGGESRIFRNAHFEDSRYVPILMLADTLWEVAERETERQLRQLSGCLLMGPAEHVQMRTAIESVREHDVSHEVLHGREFAARFPQFTLDEDELALFDHNGGYVRPELTVLSVARRAEQLGAAIHRYTPVREIAPTSGGARIRTDTEVFDVDGVVVTAGPWVEELVSIRGGVDVLRPVSAWFVPRNPKLFGINGNTRMPSFIRTAPTHFYGVPSVDGISVKLGLSSHAHQRVARPDELNRTVGTDELEAFTEIIERFVPDLIPGPVRTAAFMEAYSADRHPVVGTLPEHNNIVIIAAFSGHGFKLSPAMGEIAADLALTGSTPHPIEVFAPTRAAMSAQ